MQCGISTACLYPCQTLESLERLLTLGAGSVEIFLNAFAELRQDYVLRLREALERAGRPITSLHPFTSGLEPLLLFSEYPGRFQEGVALYRRYFEICQELGAPILVLHGHARHGAGDMAFYARRFLALAEVGAEYGVNLAQENVERCCCGIPENIRLLREAAKDSVKFVLDLKQARRAGFAPLELLEAMGPENICHLHLSDEQPGKDCCPPGEGTFNFEPILCRLAAAGSTPSAVIELYSNGFQDPQQLVRSADYIQRLAERIEKEETP